MVQFHRKIKYGFLTPIELLKELEKIYPGFSDLSAQVIDDAKQWNSDPTYHSIFFEFLPYFAGVAPTSTTQQLIDLSTIINQSALESSDLENAVSTGFLEHLHQVDSVPYLKKYLNEAAIAQLRT